MHALHRILVNLSDCGVNEADRYDVLRCAETCTEEFYKDAYDWRETDTAGRWSDEYPDNVIFARDDVDRFVNELLDARRLQEDEKVFLVEQIVKLSGSPDIREIANDNNSSMTGYYLRNLGMLKNGNYFFDSLFYDTHSYTSLIPNECIEEIKEHPNEWALALFDCHF